jgi:hypothetical protein
MITAKEARELCVTERRKFWHKTIKQAIINAARVGEEETPYWTKYSGLRDEYDVRALVIERKEFEKLGYSFSGHDGIWYVSWKEGVDNA